MAYGTWTAYADGVKPVHTLALGDGSYTVYTGLLALVANIVVAVVVQLLASARPRREASAA
jgi:SSS family solute:Na+ symporter